MFKAKVSSICSKATNMIASGETRGIDNKSIFSPALSGGLICMRELKIDQKWIDRWGSVAGAVNKNPTDPGHLSPHAGPPGWEKERGEKHSWKKKRKVQETHFLVYMNVFCGQVFHSSCSCFENEHTRQQKYTTMPKNLDFYGDSHPYRKSPRQTLSEIKKKGGGILLMLDLLPSVTRIFSRLWQSWGEGGWVGVWGWGGA